MFVWLRLEKLQHLADKVMDVCTTQEENVVALEEKVKDLEASCTSLSPDEAIRRAQELRNEIAVREGEEGK